MTRSSCRRSFHLRSRRSVGNHFAARQLREEVPRDEELGAPYAGADERDLDVDDPAVDEQSPLGGQAHGGDPAVLHPGLGDRAILGEERRLAYVEQALDPVVDVGAGVGPHDAGSDPLLTVALAGDHDAVAAGLDRQVERLVEGRRVGELGVDLDDADLVTVRPGREGGEDGLGQEVGARVDRLAGSSWAGSRFPARHASSCAQTAAP
jgi:hypothetical protein